MDKNNATDRGLVGCAKKFALNILVLVFSGFPNHIFQFKLTHLLVRI